MVINNAINYAQCAFSAYNDTTVADVSGDGTAYDIIFNQTDFDTTGNYNTATGVYIAPASGVFFFNTQALLTSVGAGHTAAYIEINNTTAGRILNGSTCSPAAGMTASNEFSLNIKGTIPVTAGDNIKVTIKVSNSTATVGVYGGAAANQKTWFEGYLTA